MAQLQKGTTYITGDQVTAANLNALVDSGILTPGAVTDQTAKTVPLAADTILLHSAADTALRKTTMTQLFATPQPLGATTPSSVAATTGTFSSTLGVTGVATLGNGAILGTPASGTVTNLTGTASININGTVGATTPSTVAGTTGTFSGNVGLTNGKLTIASAGNDYGVDLSGSSANLTAVSFVNSNASSIRWNWGIQGGTYATAGTMSLNLNGVGDAITVNGSTRSVSLPAGLNSTAIGATTPSTGAFSTLSTTGNTDIGGILKAKAGNANTTANIATYGVSVSFDNNTEVGWIQSIAGAASYKTLQLNPLGGTVTTGAALTVGGNTAITGTLSATTTITGNRIMVDNDLGVSQTSCLDIASNEDSSVRLWRSNNEFIQLAAGRGGSITGQNNVFLLDIVGNPNLRDFKIRQSSNGGSSFTDAVVLTSTGLVGIGTASPAQKLQVQCAAAGISGVFTDATNSTLKIDHSVASKVKFLDGANTEMLSLASGAVAVTGTLSTTGAVTIGGSGTVDGNIYTKSDGTTYGQYIGGGYIMAAQVGASVALLNRNGSDGNIVNFYRSGTTVGTISVTTTATAYNTSSDYRLKNVAGPVVDSGIFIDALKPKAGTWKVDGSKFVGFLAHEFAEVSPLSVSGEKDAVDSEGKPVYQSMQAGTSEVIANLVAELQSLRKRLAALESK